MISEQLDFFHHESCRGKTKRTNQFLSQRQGQEKEFHINIIFVDDNYQCQISTCGTTHIEL